VTVNVTVRDPEVGTVTEKRDRFREGDDGDGNDG
jgi:hypothetical protein